MKLKQQPEDFRVEELTEVVPGDGPFALYRLEKKGWTTPDALQAVRRRWKLDHRRLSYGGLKDRHAHTVQYFTVFRGPERGLTHHEVHVEYLGRVGRPYTSQDIRANRFQLTLRDTSREEGEDAVRALEEVRRDGVPNYFDDQRFGSASPAGEFIAKFMVLGRYEEALRLALVGPYAFDRKEQKKEKAILRAHWRNWAYLKTNLGRGHARSLVDYLVSHPEDFRGALARLKPELRTLYLSAYQSHLWNGMLARWLEGHCRPEQLAIVKLRLGTVPMHRSLEPGQLAELQALRLPLPSRARLEPDDPRGPLLDTVLREEGLEHDQLKLRGFKEMFFSKGERAALSLPANLAHELDPDDRHPGRFKLSLSFDLTRGSYATLIVKRITGGKASLEGT